MHHGQLALPTFHRLRFYSAYNSSSHTHFLFHYLWYAYCMGWAIKYFRMILNANNITTPHESNYFLACLGLKDIPGQKLAPLNFSQNKMHRKNRNNSYPTHKTFDFIHSLLINLLGGFNDKFDIKLQVHWSQLRACLSDWWLICVGLGHSCS